MFIPLSAGKRSYPGQPWATIGIILLNLLAFAWEVWLAFGVGDGAFMAWVRAWGFTPGLLTRGVGGRALTALSSMYLHSGPSHIFFNMLYLWAFAPLLEELTGSVRFFVFYTLCGLLGAALTLLLDGNSLIPGIGASGAVAGVMGAFLLLYPGQRVRTLVFIGLPFWPRLPAWILLGLWIVQQAILGQAVLEAGFNFSGIGVWAHLGGFGGGLVLATVFLRPDVMFNRRAAV
ncbi:MAG: rhomboid family intramembrane serine protease [Anaerolineales bacterium]|nr:rhomboid family intramembrane serine protease [Anaerolineales bacterium]